MKPKQENSYPNELATWIEKREAKKRRDAAAVAFLAVRVDVEAAIDAGYAVTSIYEHMHETGRVKCSYETFRKHVLRFIKTASAAKPSAAPTKADGATTVKPDATPVAPMSPKKPEPTIGGFTFNPAPKAEDFL